MRKPNLGKTIKIAGIIFVWWLFPCPAHAGSLTPELAVIMKRTDPDGKIPVIVRFVGKVDDHGFDQPTGIKGTDSGSRKIKRTEREFSGPAPVTNKTDKINRKQLIRSLKEKAHQTRTAIENRLLSHRVEKVRHLWAINAVALEADARLIGELSRDPSVERIDPDVAISMVQPMSSGHSEDRWNLDMIGAPEVWEQGFKGQGVVLAIMDTGVDGKHPDLKDQWRGGDNSWFDPFGKYDLPHDSIGHGTQVAGIAVGGDSSGSVIGVAPGAQWIAVKIYDDDGTSAYSVIHAGFQWLLDPDGDPDTDDAPDVVNKSWGFVDALDKCVAEFQEDIQILTQAGIAMVCASGNTGPNAATSVSPSNYVDSISVGAVDADAKIADFSGRGPSSCGEAIYPTFTAPGEFIRTTDLTLGGIGDPYVEVSGTSYAAAHVAGALALLMSAHPEATLFDLKQALSGGAKDLGEPGPDHVYGYGRINVQAALELLQNSSDNDSGGGGGGGCFISTTEFTQRPYQRPIEIFLK